MTAIERVAHTKAPLKVRDARRDKAAAASTLSTHALGAFYDAVDELELANELLTEVVEEDRQQVAAAESRIAQNSGAIQSNATAISKIRSLFS